MKQSVANLTPMLGRMHKAAKTTASTALGSAEREMRRRLNDAQSQFDELYNGPMADTTCAAGRKQFVRNERKLDNLQVLIEALREEIATTNKRGA